MKYQNQFCYVLGGKIKMNKKLQVFISSTYTDLKKERQAAVEAILSAGHIPAGIELFTASDESQMEVIKRWIDESDVYLLILGVRYGAIEPKKGKSYTQLEYEYALDNNKPLFSIVITEDAFKKKALEEGNDVFANKTYNEYSEFRSMVLSKMVKFYDDEKDIKLAIHTTLTDYQLRYNLAGWVSGKEIENSKYYADQLTILTEQNRLLQSKIDLLEAEHTKLKCQKTDTKSKIKFNIQSNVSKRIDKILELIGACEQDELVWLEDDNEYAVKDAPEGFTYYYVYLLNQVNEATPDIDYTLVISIDTSFGYDINNNLKSIRIMLEDHKTVCNTMKFKYVLASSKINYVIEKECIDFFNTALSKAEIPNKEQFSFEVWNDKRLLELEETLGLKVNI